MKLLSTGARGFAWTVGRIAAVVIVGALLSWCGIGKARAGTLGCPVGEPCQRGTAYAMCVAHVEEWIAGRQEPPGSWVVDCRELATSYRALGKAVSTGNSTSAFIRGENTTAAIVYNFVPCPADKPWNPETHTCGGPCDDVPNLDASAIVPEVAGERCSNGCVYKPEQEAIPGQHVQSIAIGGAIFSAGWEATGQECARSEEPEKPYDPNKPVCQRVGNTGSTECIHADGQHCITTSRGVRMCWRSNLGEEGGRQSSDGEEGADRKAQGESNTPPPGMEDPHPDGPPSNVSINGNGYTTQGYTGSGTNGPGQPNVGDGGEDPTAPGAPGDGDGDGDGDGPGSPGGGTGDLYEGSDRTVSQVVADYQNRIQNAPIRAATTGFLTVSISGSCPTFSVPATEFWSELVFDYHCSGPLADALSLGGWLILAIAAYAAFRYAFL